MKVYEKLYKRHVNQKKGEENYDLCQVDEVNTEVLTTRAYGIVSGYGSDVCTVTPVE